MVDKEEQVRLRQLAEEQKIKSATIQSRKGVGLKDFLKKKDPHMDDLKKKYFENDASQQDPNSAYKA